MDGKSRNKKGKNRERFVENTGEWTGMVEIRKEEIPGSKDLLQTLEGERLSSVFSPDGTLNSVSAAPHCGAEEKSDLVLLILNNINCNIPTK